MRRTLATFVAMLATATAAPAEARMHAPYRAHRIIPAAAAPLDGFTAPAAAYGFRKLLSSYTGSALILRRASDNAEANINFLGFVPGTGAPLDIAQANAHCAATTCFIKGFYDQSGNTRDIPQFTAGSQPQFIASCQNGSPCARFSGAQQLATTGITWAAAVTSLSVVVKRSAGTGHCIWLSKGSNWVQVDATGTWYATGFLTGGYVIPATENTWHAGEVVINGAASVARVDGTETLGAIEANPAAGAVQVTGIAATTCDWAEGVIWDGYALTAGERAALQANQKSYWGTP